MPRPITSFSGEWRFLSNFWYVSTEYEGVIYPTSEHAYQAAKTPDEAARKAIQGCGTPGQAKRLGQEVPLIPYWDAVRVEVMRDVLRAKFDPEHNPDLVDRLLGTGARRLVEGNHWGDTFWGMCDGHGSNHLGRLLMAVREELRAARK